MKRFVEGEDRRQGALLPHCLDDYVTENNPVRVIEAFIDELDLATLGFDGVVPEIISTAISPSSDATEDLEVGCQPPGQPHQLDIALRFPFEPPARLCSRP
jgi:hypothetical protein